MELTPVESKLLAGIGYDEKTRTLHIRFAKGGEYTYHDVAPEKHAELMAAKSVGSHFLFHVKPNHKCTRHEK